MEGRGSMYYENSELAFEGDFKNGVFEGKGKLYFKNGKLEYEGDFLDGKMDGKGTLYDDKGEKLKSGVFKKGILLHGVVYEKGKVKEKTSVNLKVKSLNNEVKRYWVGTFKKNVVFEEEVWRSIIVCVVGKKDTGKVKNFFFFNFFFNFFISEHICFQIDRQKN